MSHAAVVALVPAPGERVVERLAVTPGWLVVVSALDNALQALGEGDEAVAVLTAAIAQRPADPEGRPNQLHVFPESSHGREGPSGPTLATAARPGGRTRRARAWRSEPGVVAPGDASAGRPTVAERP